MDEVEIQQQLERQLKLLDFLTVFEVYCKCKVIKSDLREEFDQVFDELSLAYIYPKWVKYIQTFSQVHECPTSQLSDAAHCVNI